MAIKPNGDEKEGVAAPTGGSPRGWTVIGTAAECWTKWASKYVFGVSPAKTPAPLLLGSAYHLFQEGASEDAVRLAYGDYTPEAKRLFEVRKKGPPLPPNSKATIEKQFPIFGGLMTSKPDRIETSGSRKLVRDFKTAGSFSEHDEATWNVDGGILGECIAADTDAALVDIVSKREGASPGTKIVTSHLTERKRRALHQMVLSFWAEAEKRTKALAKVKKVTRDDVLAQYTPNLKACVGKYGPCAYYARCWGKPPESMLYVQARKPPREWADFEPAISWRKQLDAVYEAGKGVM